MTDFRKINAVLKCDQYYMTDLKSFEQNNFISNILKSKLSTQLKRVIRMDLKRKY